MRHILCLAIAFVLLSAATAQAENSIAVFDLQKVAAESEPLKEAVAALDVKFGAQKEALEKERQELEKKTMELAKKKSTEAEQQALAKEHRDFQEKGQAFMRIFQADETRVRMDLDTIIESAAKELAAKKGYVMLLDIAAVPYVDPKLDVTNDMLTEVNTLWKNSKKTQ